MISVVIATYNRAAMVRQAINAALAQMQPGDELIVSDDASTDETAVVLAEASKDPRLKSFRQESNSRGIGNWNFAFRQTCGEFIAMCSDDDRFLPGHLDASVAYLRAHPQVGLVHSGFVDSLEMSDSLQTVARPLRSSAPILVERRNLLRYLIRYYDWPFHPSTIVMRRDVWDRVGLFDPNYSLFDTDWFVRAAELYSIVMLPRHGVINRRHAGNWSNRLGSARMQREIFEIGERFIARRPGKFAFSKSIESALWRTNVRLRLALTLRARLRSGHRDAALTAWLAICRFTGRTMPQWIERGGERAIETYLRRHGSSQQESVSPL